MSILFPLHSDDIPFISVILYFLYIYNIYTTYIPWKMGPFFCCWKKQTVSLTAKTSQPRFFYAQHLWTGQIQDLDDHLGWDPPVVTLYDVLKLHENPLPPKKKL